MERLYFTISICHLLYSNTYCNLIQYLPLKTKIPHHPPNYYHHHPQYIPGKDYLN